MEGTGSGQRRLDLIGSDTTETGIDAENIVDSQESNVDEVPETSVPRGGRRRPRMLVLDDDTDDSEVEVVDLTSPDRLVHGTDTISPPCSTSGPVSEASCLVVVVEEAFGALPVLCGARHRCLSAQRRFQI